MVGEPARQHSARNIAIRLRRDGKANRLKFGRMGHSSGLLDKPSQVEECDVRFAGGQSPFPHIDVPGPSLLPESDGVRSAAQELDAALCA